MKLNFLAIVLFGFALTTTAAQATSSPGAVPTTPKHPVETRYHGIKVVDPYEWLEQTSNPEVQKWTEAQSAYARKYLDSLPALKPIKAQLQKWNGFKSPKYRGLQYVAGQYFVLKLDPPKNQPMLVMLNTLQNIKSERILLDPNTLDATGTTAIDFFVPSLDGRYIAVSMSKGGSEIGTLSIYRTEDGKKLTDEIPAVNRPTGGGSVTWNQDATGLYYTRYPSPGERPQADLDFFQQVYFHKLGTSTKDDIYAIGKDFPRIAEIRLTTSRNGHYVLASVANGDGGEFAHYTLALSKPAQSWTQITHFEDKVTSAVLGLQDDLFITSLKDAPKGKILRLSLAHPVLKDAQTTVPESPRVVEDVLPTENRVYVVYLNGGPSELRSFDQEGKEGRLIPTPELSSVGGMIRLENDQIVFASQSYTQPPARFRYEAGPSGAGKLQKTALAEKSPVSFRDIEVKREFVRSKDGTQVPMTIVYRKTTSKGIKLDGSHPTLLYAYGGYSISMVPHFQTDLYLWLQRGGIYVVANIRGGGEYGESWHRSGNLAKKQNAFDDFIACAEHLISAKYTSKKKLAIEGGSNGGLLMGAVLTQRPDLFQAVVSHVGIYDMLRVERDANGAFNVTEFGTVKDPEQFKALYGYSPLHHVVDGTAYPAVLLLSGANDGRVNPYHSKKMAARLQSANSSRNPILLRIAFDSGHGIGRSTAQRVAEESDAYAFLFSQLGMRY